MQAVAARVALAGDGPRGLCDRELLLGFVGISAAATVSWANGCGVVSHPFPAGQKKSRRKPRQFDRDQNAEPGMLL